MINDKWIKKNYILENITKGGEGIAYIIGLCLKIRCNKTKCIYIEKYA